MAKSRALESFPGDVSVPFLKASEMFVRDNDGSFKPKSDLEGLRDHTDMETDTEKRRAPVNDRLKRILESCRYNPQKLPSKQAQQYRQERQDLEMIMRLKEDRELFRLNTSRLAVNQPQSTPQRPFSIPTSTPSRFPPVRETQPILEKRSRDYPATKETEPECESLRIPPPAVVFPQKRRVSSLPPTENRRPPPETFYSKFCSSSSSSSNTNSSSTPQTPTSYPFNQASRIKEEKRAEEEEEEDYRTQIFPSFLSNNRGYPGPPSWLPPPTSSQHRSALPQQQPHSQEVTGSPPRKRRFLDFGSSTSSSSSPSSSSGLPLVEPKRELNFQQPVSSFPVNGTGSWTNSNVGFAKRMF